MQTIILEYISTCRDKCVYIVCNNRKRDARMAAVLTRAVGLGLKVASFFRDPSRIGKEEFNEHKRVVEPMRNV